MEKYTVLQNKVTFSVQSGNCYVYCFASMRDAEKAAELANEAYKAGHNSAGDAYRSGRIIDPDQFREDWPSPEFRAKVYKLLEEAKKAREDAVEFAECVRLMAKFEAKIKATKTVIINNWVEGLPPTDMYDEIEIQIIGGQHRTAKRTMTTQSNSLFFTDCKHSMQNAYCDQLMIHAWRIKSQ